MRCVHDYECTLDVWGNTSGAWMGWGMTRGQWRGPKRSFGGTCVSKQELGNETKCAGGTKGALNHSICCISGATHPPFPEGVLVSELVAQRPVEWKRSSFAYLSSR